MAEDFFAKWKEFETRLRACEERLADQVYDTTGLIDSEFKRRDRKEMHRSMEFSTYKAWVVDTLDSRRQARVRYYSPYLHEPKTPICNLPWASAISTLPGFDDSGSVWIPPAGSTIMLIYEAGGSHNAYYIGTIWNRYRGSDGNNVWNPLIPIPEYDAIHSGHRKGYFIGPNDGSQVFPPWNTENYNAIDLGSKVDVDTDGSVGGKQPCMPCKDSYPHIMGMKTPQKHMIKFVDGDYKCDHRWKRLEIMSSLGNWMIFKDDHLHEGGQWVNPQCNVPCGGGANLDCVDENCHPIPVTDCKITEGTGRNKYFKHQNECRPYKGPGTPQNNRCNLPQAGIQILSTSGHTMIFDDSVEQPRGIPKWEKVLEPFDFGCSDVFLGRMIFKSTTGHRFEMNDEEQETNVRGRRNDLEQWQQNCDPFDPWSRPIIDRTERPARNGILLLTATGNRVELNDDTLPDDMAGPNRGITLQSTSNHVIEMIDHLNKQGAPARMDGGIPINEAKRAYIRIRSGYGLSMEFRDSYSQTKTEQQYIQITAPQYDACCGPHFIRMQESPTCGFVLVRAGGDYVRSTDRHELIVVGPGCYGPSNRFLSVSDNYVVDVANMYYNQAHLHVLDSETYIILAAGRDCHGPHGPAPCIVPVATMKCAAFCPIVRSRICLDVKSFSTRVFVSVDDSKCS